MLAFVWFDFCDFGDPGVPLAPSKASLGGLWGNVGTRTGPRAKKAWILTLPRHPRGSLWGAFWAPFSFWDASGGIFLH